MLPFELFRRRNFAVANLQTFIVYAALYGTLVFFTLYLQFLGFSPFEAGLLQVPTSLVMVAAGGAVRRARRRARAAALPHPRPVFLVGFGTLCALRAQREERFLDGGLRLAWRLTSLGLAMLVAPITSTALKSAPSSTRGSHRE